jgi:hypothetical protein
VFEQLLNALKQISCQEQSSVSSMIGYVYKVDDQATIIIKDDPELHQQVRNQQNLNKNFKMKIYILSNIKFFINLQRNFQNFDSGLPFKTKSGVEG